MTEERKCSDRFELVKMASTMKSEEDLGYYHLSAITVLRMRINDSFS